MSGVITGERCHLGLYCGVRISGQKEVGDRAECSQCAQPVEPLGDTVTPRDSVWAALAPRGGFGRDGEEGLWEGSRQELSCRAGHLFFPLSKEEVLMMSQLLLLLMNNLFAAFSEEHGLGLGLKAQFD